MEPLYLGVARKIITPAVGGNLYGYRPDVISESVGDDLTVDAYYFKQGQTVALLINATVCAIAEEVCNDLRQEIESRFGVPAEACMISAIHTHSGPCLTGAFAGWGSRDIPYIENIFRPKVMEAVEEALQCPVQVVMGAAKGDSLVGINRRELTLKNEIVLGQNPWGPFNPRMSVISFRSLSGETVASFIHYGCHPTSAGQNRQITRDWPGVMVDAMEEKIGGFAAFFNGPEGDVGPRLSNGLTVGNRSLDYVYEHGAFAAQDALRIYEQITEYTTPELKVACPDCKIPMRPRMSREEAEAMYEKYKGNAVNISALLLTTAQRVLESYDNGYEEEKECVIEQPIVMLGNWVLVGTTYELFSEIGLRVDKAFPNAEILTVVNTNGSTAYFVTEDAICRGGYEVGHFLYDKIQPYCENADFELVKEMIRNLEPLVGEAVDTDFVDPAS